jgi:carbamoyltransferase
VTREDLAHTAQLVFSELVIELCRNLHDRIPAKALLLGGGCALNSSCNGEIVEATPFEQLFVFSAPADDGNAVGAALLAHHEDHGPQRRTSIRSPYLGSELSEETLERAERFGKIPNLVRHDDVEQRAAELLAEGRILGWAQGRAEFGPRALGNRSILADPRRADMKDRINALVKFREAFRPFAPSILHEFGDEYFEAYQESPYMERTLRLRPEVRNQVPAVVHVDGTGRLQTVREEWNPRYYRLIRAFYERTGVPMLLNTSLNIMGKPIIHSVEDALALFYTTGLEALVVGDRIIDSPARD